MIIRTLQTVALWVVVQLLPSFTIANDVPDFEMIDHAGRFHQLGRNTDATAVVLLSYKRDSAAARAALPELLSLSRRYQGAPVRFMVLVSDSNETRASLSELAQSYETDIPF